MESFTVEQGLAGEEASSAARRSSPGSSNWRASLNVPGPRRGSGTSFTSAREASSFTSIHSNGTSFVQNVVHGVHSARTEGGSFTKESLEAEGPAGVPAVVAEAGGLTQYEAIVSIILMCFGVGLAVLPKAMSEAGYIITPVLMVLCAAVCSEQNLQVSRGCELAEELTGKAVTCFEDLAEVCGGSVWLVMLRVSKAFGLLSAVSSFVEFAAANTVVLAMATGWFGGEVGKEEKQRHVNYVRFFLVMPIMMSLAMLKDLKDFARIMNVGVLAATVNGGAIVLGGVLRAFSVPSCASQQDPLYANGLCIFRSAPPSDEGSAVFQIGMAASVCLFGIMVAGSYPNTRHQMAEPKQIMRVATTSFWLTLGIFSVVMIGGYIGSGQAVKDNVLDSFHDTPSVQYIGLLAQVIDTLVASPIYILCVINAVESTGTDGLRTPLAVPNIIMRAGTVACVTILSYSVPYPEIIMIEASFFGILTHLVWPAFLTEMLKRKWIAAGKDPDPVQISLIRRVARIAIVLFGLLVCFFSIYGAAQKLADEMAAS